MLRHVWKFLRKPTYRSYSNAPIWYKRKIFFNLLGWNLLIGITIALLNVQLASSFGIDTGEHATEKLFKEFSLFTIFCIVVLFAPVVEELIFRGPLVFFRSSAYFNIAFYLSIIGFAAIHASNFENMEEGLWLLPLLVAPQFIMGIFLGYIRVTLGLSWSVLLHACHNGILLTPVILSELLKIPSE
jgi:membrane protease YdiL (CAAX protease family)